MSERDLPVTAAIRALRSAKATFSGRLYPYVERGGTAHAAVSLGVPEHEVVKTLVMESHEEGKPRRAFLVLMHGDREVSTKELARVLGVKSVAPASEAAVTKYTGYVPGGVSPFGTRTALPVYAEETLFSLPRILVNGGKRGFLVEIAPEELLRLLPITKVSVASG